MSLERTGVEFIAKDIRKYLKSFADANEAIKKSNRALRDFERSQKEAGSVSKSFEETIRNLASTLADIAKNPITAFRLGIMSIASVLKKAGGAIASFAGVTKSLIGGVFNLFKGAVNTFVIAPLKKLSSFIKGVFQVTIGVLLRDAIRSVIKVFQELRNVMLEAASSMAALEIRMQNMIARSARLSGVVTGVKESFEAAKGAAQVLMRWIEKVGGTAPVDTKTITDTLTYAMTLNQTTEEAKELTESILEFTTAMGLNSEIAGRIITNFVQMQRQGKITGREITDLGRGAMVPTTDILRDMSERLGDANQSWEQFLKDVSAGRYPVEEFLTSFKNIVERDFPEAFERMRTSLQGSIQLLKNWARTVGGLRLLGPVTKEIGKSIADMVDTLYKEENLQKISALGDVLKKSFLALKPVVKDLVDGIKNLASATGLAEDPVEALAQAVVGMTAVMKVAMERVTDTLNNMAGNLSIQAGDWGKNIVTQLAKGMAVAASLVLKVIAQIGTLIAKWLKPGSPPKVAPNLDKWGAGAMTAYMQGWLSGDFGVFGEISSIISGYIQSLDIDEKSVIPAILGSRKEMAEAIRQMKDIGHVTTSMINDIVSSIPNATDAFRKYIRATLELKNAQMELNNINEKYSEILDGLKKKLGKKSTELKEETRLEKINKALASGRLTEAEKARLEAEKQDILIRQQIRSVEEQRDIELDAAQEKVDALTEQKEANEELIRVQTEQNNLIKDQMSLFEELTDAIGGMAGSLEEMEESMEDALLYAAPNLDGLDEDIDMFDFEGMFADAEEAVNKFFDNVATQFSGLESDMSAVKEAWGSIFSSSSGRPGTPEYMDDSPINDVGAKLDEVKKRFEQFKRFMQITGTVLNVLWKTIFGTLLALILGVVSGTALFTLGFKKFFKEINDGYQLIKEGVLDVWEGDILGGVEKIGEGLETIIKAPIETFKALFEGAKTAVIDTFEMLRDVLVGNSIVPDMMDSMEKIISESLDDIKEFFSEKLTGKKDSVLNTVTNLKDSAKKVVDKWMDGMKDKIEVVLKDVVDLFLWAYNKIVGHSIIPDMMGDINQVMDSGLTKSSGVAENWAASFVDSAKRAATAVQASTHHAASVMQPSVVNNNNTNKIVVNASYENRQSPANVRLDVEASLAAASL